MQASNGGDTRAYHDLPTHAHLNGEEPQDPRHHHAKFK